MPTASMPGSAVSIVSYAGVVEAHGERSYLPWAFGPRCAPWSGLPHQAALKEKTFKHLAFQGSGAFGNAATRLDAFAHQQGAQSWIKDPEIDAWYAQQAVERDRKKREALLHKIQQKLYDEALFYSDLGTRLSVRLGATRPRCQG